MSRNSFVVIAQDPRFTEQRPMRFNTSPHDIFRTRLCQTLLLSLSLCLYRLAAIQQVRSPTRRQQKLTPSCFVVVVLFVKAPQSRSIGIPFTILLMPLSAYLMLSSQVILSPCVSPVTCIVSTSISNTDIASRFALASLPVGL